MSIRLKHIIKNKIIFFFLILLILLLLIYIFYPVKNGLATGPLIKDGDLGRDGGENEYELYSWGSNEFSQMGFNPYEKTPVDLNVSDISKLFISKTFFCSLDNSDYVNCWSDKYSNWIVFLSVVNSNSINSLSLGDNHFCLLLDNHTIKCAGFNNSGELGVGNYSDLAYPFTLVLSIDNALQVGVGFQHTCARLSTGEIKCWGRNSYGQLGDGTTTVRKNTPVLVSEISNATDLSLGENHSCAILSTGEVKCWGLNTYGQLGNNSTINSNLPVSVSGISNAIQLSLGENHSCARLSTGAIKCWGLNSAGQLGNNSTTNSSVPVSVSGISNATQLSLGDNHSCSRLSTGEVKCWGINTHGQLGNNSTTNSLSPVNVSGLTTAVEVISSTNNSCARFNDNTAKCWGKNDYDQLKISTDYLTPILIPTISDISYISAGENHSCAVLTDGTVKCWGINTNLDNTSNSNNFSIDRLEPVVVSSLSDIEKVSSLIHNCAVDLDQNIYCWGGTNINLNHYSGELGNLTTLNTNNIIDSTNGISYSCALLDTNEVYCWGKNNYGQLGDGEFIELKTPTLIDSTGNWQMVSASKGGYNATYGLKDYKLYSWGARDFSQLGIIAPFSEKYRAISQIGTFSDWDFVSSGHDYCAFGIREGKLYRWGCTSSSKSIPFQVGTDTDWQSASYFSSIKGNKLYLYVGYGNFTQISDDDWQYVYDNTDPSYLVGTGISNGKIYYWSKSNPVITPIGNDSGWQKIAFNVGIKNGELYSWSYSPFPDISTVPEKISPESGWQMISKGVNHYIGIRDGRLYAWGSNEYGQLGDGTNNDIDIPTQIGTHTDWTHVSAGNNYSMAIRNGDLYGWGTNFYNVLGSLDFITLETPRKVYNLSNVNNLVSSRNHSCALLNNGTVKCWGSNSNGQLGDNSIKQNYYPVDVYGLENVLQVAVGEFHSCALLTNGTVKCWGLNSAGQLGNNSTTNSWIPVNVLGISNAIKITLGADHSCALLSDKKVKCWGSNFNGQLGNNSTTNSSVPVLVSGLDNVEFIDSSTNHTYALVLLNQPLEQVQAPVATPSGGTYTTSQEVSLSSSTSGATIRYTTNGVNPTSTTGTLYSSPITISSTTTLKAIAYKDGMAQSDILINEYIITSKVSTPVANPLGGSFTSAQTVSLSTSTPGATIRYTTNGVNPTSTTGTVYSSPVIISSTTTLKAIAYKSGMEDSSIMSQTYTINIAPSKVQAPFTSPSAGTYTSSQTISLSSATSGATIRYTTNGVNPTSTTGTVYSSPITISSTTTLKAIAYKSGMEDSDVITFEYVINNLEKVSKPYTDPEGATYNSAQTVSLATATSGATIRYTTNGTIPTSTIGTIYSSPITISSTTTLKAIAYKDNMEDSDLLVEDFIINSLENVATPVASPSGGSYTSSRSVSLSTSTSGATIRYTLNGTTPTSSVGTVYSGIITISSTTTLKAIAYKSGMNPSNVLTSTYTISSSNNNGGGGGGGGGGNSSPPPALLKVSTPSSSLDSGSYNESKTISFSTSTSGATIRYTLNGTTPTSTNGLIYSQPITIDQNTIVKVVAYKEGMTISDVLTLDYIIIIPSNDTDFNNSDLNNDTTNNNNNFIIKIKSEDVNNWISVDYNLPIKQINLNSDSFIEDKEITINNKDSFDLNLTNLNKIYSYMSLSFNLKEEKNKLNIIVSIDKNWVIDNNISLEDMYALQIIDGEDYLHKLSYSELKDDYYYYSLELSDLDDSDLIILSLDKEDIIKENFFKKYLLYIIILIIIIIIVLIIILSFKNKKKDDYDILNRDNLYSF